MFWRVPLDCVRDNFARVVQHQKSRSVRSPFGRPVRRSEAGKKSLRHGRLPREHCQSPATTLWRTQAILKYSPSSGLIAVFAIIS